jgi:hypothetical protein
VAPESGAPSTTPSVAGGALRRTALSWDHIGDLRRARPALLFACLAGPVFAALDLVYLALGGEGHLLALAALRALPLPFFVLGAIRTRRRPPISERELHFLVYAAIYVVTLSVALECVDTGGMHSVYAAAQMPVLAITTMVPRPWRKHAIRMLPVLLFHPAAMILGALFYPPMHGQLEDPHALLAFGGTSVMITTTAIIVIFASNHLWSLRREVFEARSIGRYELRRRIGKGGMGEVWAAWHRGLEKEVALKILKLEDERDEAAVARFEREVRLSSGLTHPHTVRVFDSGTTEDGLLYFAMELLDGRTLAQLVTEDGPLPPERAVHLVLQAARALAEAHDRGIVHRDLKPENLFVTTAGGESDFLKVLDFGIARVSNEAAQLTRTGAAPGTPSTMSPEVINGSPATAASDVYGLGAVMYQALTGRPPFAEGGAASTLVAHLRDAPIPPSQRVATPIPEDVEAIVLRCLAKKPEQRYADGRALAEALARSSSFGRWAPAPVGPKTTTLSPPRPEQERANASGVTTASGDARSSEERETRIEVRRPS